MKKGAICILFVVMLSACSQYTCPTYSHGKSPSKVFNPVKVKKI
jgi:PBP1b-binding outer membrane lipoprotein LpoB